MSDTGEPDRRHGTERRAGEGRRSSDVRGEALLAAVQSLDASLHAGREEFVEARRQSRQDVERIDARLDEIPKVYLPAEVAKQRARTAAIIAGIVATFLILMGIGVLVLVLVFRAQEHTREHQRVRDVAAAAQQQRQTLISGCERSNELRAALGRALERAYAPAPIPDGLPPELADLYAQAQLRQAAQREEQLKDPGVQPVDCAKAFPLITPAPGPPGQVS